MQTNTSNYLYKQIQEDNVRKYGTESPRIMKIIINQYSDRTHFIYEILQNTEDAEATYIKFYLYRDKLLVIHNGRHFNEKDIVGVCGIADGTKDDGSRIGHFGIGFKSVYGYTSTPEIYSGQYCFKIENQLFPSGLSPMKNLSDRETCMILPFDKPEVQAKTAFEEISNALIKKITAESILILNSIADVSIEIDGRPEMIEINKEKGTIDNNCNVYDLSLLTTITNQNTGVKRDTESNYLFFTDAEKEATAIIFKIIGKELQEVRNSKIYTFFPTAKEAHQNFFIHAPFDTTPARDNFKEGAEYGKHNIELIKNIGQLIYFAFCWLRDNGYLSISGLNKVFPIYEYEEDDVLYSIYQKSIDIINQGEKLLPTNKPGVFKGINEICVPSNMGIVNVFDDDDLQCLELNHKKFWISKEISTNAYAELKVFLDKNFRFKTYEWKDLVMKMDASYLKVKPISWMERLFSNIESFCIRRTQEHSSHFIDVSKVPLVRISTGEQICAKQNGKFQVYLNNPAICKYKIDSDFRKNESISSFYSRALGIPEYNIVRETFDKILPKYDSKQVAFKTDNHIRENIEDLKEIKNAIYVNPSIIDAVKDKYIVTDGKEWYKTSVLFIRSDDVRSGYSLIRNIVSINYLSNQYFDDTVLNIKLDEDFFRKIGCSFGIRVVQVPKETYLEAVRKYCGRSVADELRARIFRKQYITNKMDWSFNYQGFPEIFEGITVKKSINIAKFLNKNVVNFDIQSELVGADDQHFSGANVDSMSAYSMIGLQLTFEKWIFVEGNPEPQRPIDIAREDILQEYNVAKRLMGILLFKEINNAVADWLKDNISDKSERDMIKRLFAKPEELSKIAKAVAKSEAQIAARDAKKGDILDKIKKGDKAQIEQSTSGDGPELSPISERGLEKRSKNLDKELAETLDNKIKVVRGLQFVSRSCNSEERTFLEQEYEGYCQICLKKIVKHDGKKYFEAINIIKQNEMFDKYIGGLKYAWNSLCLCPNCAAEYNYCSKKISGIYDQVIQTEVEPGSEEPININIEMPEGTHKKIHYSPRHFLALKESFKVYTAD